MNEQTELRKEVKSIWRILAGSNTKPDKPGLCQRVTTIENEHKKIRKYVARAIWIFISLLLLNNAPALFNWLAKILTAKPNP